MNPTQNIDKKNSKGISLKPLITEKAVMLIESQNVLIFETEKESTKEQIKKEIENLFEVKVEKIRTLIILNKKHILYKSRPILVQLKYG